MKSMTPRQRISTLSGGASVANGTTHATELKASRFRKRRLFLWLRLLGNI